MPGSRTLYLLRHAKSSWDDPRLDDHDRPLAPRGRRATAALAQHVRDAGIAPELVLCSSAQRARQTLEDVAPPGKWEIDPELYGASANGVLGRLRRLPDSVQSVMVIGHNPTMQILILSLAGDRGQATDSSDLAEVQRKFPTGALATLSFACDWSELGPHRARLIAYVHPKLLQRR